MDKLRVSKNPITGCKEERTERAKEAVDVVDGRKSKRASSRAF
jgi:hypothetical protein